MKPAEPRVLVVPEGGICLCFRLLPILRDAGCAIDVLCLRGDVIAASRYVDTVIEEGSDDALLDRLATLVRQKEHPWRAVIVTHESLTRRLISRADSDFLKWWQPGALDKTVRAFLLSKLGLEAAGKNSDLPIPPSRVCMKREEILAFGSDTGWPVVIKPPLGNSGEGITIVGSSDALKSLQRGFQFPVLAQRFIRGREGVVEAVCSQGLVLACLASEIIKRRKGRFGPATARLFAAMPELHPLVEEVARYTRFEGFCGFDWIQDEQSGRYYLIEFNPRPPPGFRFGRFCGVDFGRAVVAWLNGTAKEFALLCQPQENPVAAYYFPHELGRCLRERDWQAFKQWLPGSRAIHDICWDDPLPMGVWVTQRLKSLVSLRAWTVHDRPKVSSRTSSS